MLRISKALSIIVGLASVAPTMSLAQPYYASPPGPYGYYPRDAPPRGPGFRCAAGPRGLICDLADAPRPLGSQCYCEPPFPGRPPLPGRVIR